MRLSISNLAWDVSEDEQVAELLIRHRVDAIDVAPGKYFFDMQSASVNDVASVRGVWADRGIDITGMQALLFGTNGLNLFGDANVQAAMLKQFQAVCRVGAGLGANRLVFGSPKNRDRMGLSDAQALDMAIPFFRQLGHIADGFGVSICLEPNPARYACNFLLTSDEVAQVVHLVDHPAICMQLDTGAITINSEDVSTVVSAHSDVIGHVHASEPDLMVLGDGGTDHAFAAMAIERHLPSHVVCIEMLATRAEPHLQAIERALGVANRCYRSGTPSEDFL